MVGIQGALHRCWITITRYKLIWNSNWLPSNEYPAIRTPPLAGFENASVNLLINNDCCGWNNQLLGILLSEFEQQLIRRLQIPWSQQEDGLYWRFELRGNFSVKSCYYAFLQGSNVNILPS